MAKPRHSTKITTIFTFQFGGFPPALEVLEREFVLTKPLTPIAGNAFETEPDLAISAWVLVTPLLTDSCEACFDRIPVGFAVIEELVPARPDCRMVVGFVMGGWMPIEYIPIPINGGGETTVGEDPELSFPEKEDERSPLVVILWMLLVVLLGLTDLEAAGIFPATTVA
jgi:hypothetical protein